MKPDELLRLSLARQRLESLRRPAPGLARYNAPLAAQRRRYREAGEPPRLRADPGLLLFGQHPLPRRPAAGRPDRRFRPPGWRRDLRPDRGDLYPAGLVPDARPMAAVDPGDRLGSGGHGHGHDRD